MQVQSKVSQELAPSQPGLPAGISPAQWQVLRSPIPDERVYLRVIGGGMEVPYFDAPLVIERLNATFPGQWYPTIADKGVHGTESVWVQLELHVLTPSGVLCITDFGTQELRRGMPLGDAYKGAVSDAIKRCGRYLGIGLEFWIKEDRDNILLEKKQQGMKEQEVQIRNEVIARAAEQGITSEVLDERLRAAFNKTLAEMSLVELLKVSTGLARSKKQEARQKEGVN